MSSFCQLCNFLIFVFNFVAHLVRQLWRTRQNNKVFKKRSLAKFTRQFIIEQTCVYWTACINDERVLLMKTDITLVLQALRAARQLMRSTDREVRDRVLQQELEKIAPLWTGEEVRSAIVAFMKRKWHLQSAAADPPLTAADCLHLSHPHSLRFLSPDSAILSFSQPLLIQILIAFCSI